MKRRRQQPGSRHPRRLVLDKWFKPPPVDNSDELFPNGIFEFNITKILAFIETNPDRFPVEEVNIEPLRGYSPEILDEKTIRRADLSKPIILAEISPGRFNVIDGNHRVEKAGRKGQRAVLARRIGPEQHVAFLTSVRAYEAYVGYWNSKLAEMEPELGLPSKKPLLKGNIFQLKVTLNDIEPKIWRRLLVPGDFTLEELHEVLQVSMGWTNSHLHQFLIGETFYGIPDDEFDEVKIRDEQDYTIEKVLPKKGRKIVYEYDFGDSWEHLVVVEDIHSPKGWQPNPQCLNGARRCPPEDVGSTSGYENFLTVIKDSKHPEHHEMLRWAGGPFNPEEFRIDAVNESLKKLHEAGSLEALWPPED